MNCDYTLCEYQCCVGDVCGSSYARCNLSTILVASCLIFFIGAILALIICWKKFYCLFKNRSKISMRKPVQVIFGSINPISEANLLIKNVLKENNKFNQTEIYSTDNMSRTAIGFVEVENENSIVNVVEEKSLSEKENSKESKYLDNESPETKKEEDILGNVNNEDRYLGNSMNETSGFGPAVVEENNYEVVDPFDGNPKTEYKIVLKRGKDPMNIGVTPL